MRFRKLRIAWSVVWGVAAVLLLVLWVRSYWRLDEFGCDGAPSTEAVISQNGTLSASIVEEIGHPRWHYSSGPVVDHPAVRDLLFIDFYDDRKQHVLLAAFPHWMVAAAL